MGKTDNRESTNSRGLTRVVRHLRLNHTVAIIFLGLALLGVGASSRYALLTVLLDGVGAAIIMVPAMLAGLWLVPLLLRESPLAPRFDMMPLRWHLLLGTALGLGGISLLILMLGLIGFLQRPLWIAILFVLAVAGVVRLRILIRAGSAYDRPPRARAWGSDPQVRWWACLWLLACPFAVLALLAASTAPGLIRQEEGFGYDVLEYHLQLPKEYVQAGRIEYIPHNVYGNFPANVEMLYLLAMIVHDNISDVGVTANTIHLMFALLAVFAAWVAGREWSPGAGIVCAVILATGGWLTYLCGLAYVENGMLFFGMTATALLLRHVRLRADNEEGDEPDDKPNATAGPWRSVAAAGVVAGLACGCKYTALPLIAAPLAFATLLQSGCSIRRRIVEGFVFAAATFVTFAPWIIKNQVMTGNPVFPLVNSVFKASPPGWGEEETAGWDRGHSLRVEERTLSGRLGPAWDHILWDKYQRFGPAIFVVALGGLIRRRRDGVDRLLMIVLLAQVGTWMFGTHLFARFAVVLLIPLALLSGRALHGSDSPVRLWTLIVALLAGSCWNFAHTARLHRREAPGDVPASLIYDGMLPGFEYFRAVNHDLPPDAKILLIGDAKPFYFQRDVDYCVTFNRNPFLVAVQAAKTPQDVLHWLAERGYSHVLVNWTEVRRLTSTYGLSPATDERKLKETFDRLSAAGMPPFREFRHPITGGRYVDLYEVPR